MVAARTVSKGHGKQLPASIEQLLISLSMTEFRAMRRSLVLAMSDDPARRAKAMPVGELQSRVFVMNERSKGASREEAWERLQAAIAAQHG